MGYKNFVGSRRASWRILSALEDKEKTKGRDENAAKITDYRSKVEEELEKICAEIIDTLKENLIPRMEKSESADAAETSVFYHKMSGDYYRYLSEFRASPGREEAGEKACESYEKATEIASGKNGLHPTHPTRLGLALNYSVFHYEISNDPTKACALARTAFDEAITDLDTLDDESYKDSTLIMQLLRDNLTLWTSDMQTEGILAAEKNNLVFIDPIFDTDFSEGGGEDGEKKEKSEDVEAPAAAAAAAETKAS